MENQIVISPIGHIRSDLKEKFGIPRQSGRAPSLVAEIVFEPNYRDPDFFRGIEGFSHLWLLFDFSLTRNRPVASTVRPPRLGGNKRVGVFASRSPFRPNHIGLSCVRLERIERTSADGLVLVVSGADLLDGTPIFDVKPYLPLADCHTDALGGYAAQNDHLLQVEFPQDLLSKIPEEKRAGLCECLADDPRPSYQDDPSREYGVSFAGWNILFCVSGDRLTVTGMESLV